MGNFRNIAINETSLCPLMNDRQKLNTDEIIGEELTVVAFDFAPKFDDSGKKIVDPETGEVDEYAVITFKEKPDHFYTAGTVVTKICQAWLAGYDTPQAASEALAAEGGVKLKFEKSRTRSGRNLTNVSIL